MKILSVQQIREADEYTIQHEPITHLDLMERAAANCFQWLTTHLSNTHEIKIFCGAGNNGGDGFAIARMLFRHGFAVNTYLVGEVNQLSPSCRTNYERLQAMKVPVVTGDFALPQLTADDTVIDALFGSGLTRPVQGKAAAVIKHINDSPAMVISIDLPSGLLTDKSSRDIENPLIIHADHTLTFAPLKLALLFPENVVFTGRWHLLDIQISETYMELAETENYYIDSEWCGTMIRKRGLFDHKGMFGHALLISGSLGKAGASVLAAGGCLRSGAGLVTVHAPACNVPVIQVSVPEAMVSVDPSDNTLSSLPNLAPYSAIGIGPGTGTTEETEKVLKLLIQECSVPLVLDADAINILASNKTWLAFLKPGTIFTPHLKEFERLCGKSNNDFDRNRRQREFSVKHQAYVVLKGAHTAITTPNGNCYFNSSGNPGMATAGSGDVLTGIITGLLAQRYPTLYAVVVGVYLHGLAGDIALQSTGFEALVAGDLITNLGKAFQSLYGKF